VIDFWKKLFGPSGSSSTAKERLRLVLMTDHLALAPDMIDAMKRDLVDVISRYVEVDRQKIEVNFEQQDKALAMLANIPIISVNRPSGGEPQAAEKPAPPPQPPAAEPVATAPVPATDPATNQLITRRRRRRRAKTPAGTSGGSVPASAAPKPATAH
jgi:cell division topological specificity factor